jgi:hypothetical protein
MFSTGKKAYKKVNTRSVFARVSPYAALASNITEILDFEFIGLPVLR